MLGLGHHTEAPVIFSKVVVRENVLVLGVRRTWRDGRALSWANLRCRRSWRTHTHTHTHTHTYMWRGWTGVSQSHSLEEMVQQTMKIWLLQSSCQLEATVSGSKVPPLMYSSRIQASTCSWSHQVILSVQYSDTCSLQLDFDRKSGWRNAVSTLLEKCRYARQA